MPFPWRSRAAPLPVVWPAAGPLRPPLLGVALCWLLSGAPAAAAGALPVAFGADALATEWTFEQESRRCTLTQTIDDYGRGRFVMGADSVPTFELLALRPHLTDAPIVIDSVAPAWHPQYPAQRVLTDDLQSRAGDLQLSGDLVTLMLLQLREGYQLRFLQQGAATVPADLAVLLSPVRFRAVHAGFSECGRHLTAARAREIEARDREIEELRENTVWFATDSASLMPDGRQRLDRLAALVREIAGESEPFAADAAASQDAAASLDAGPSRGAVSASDRVQGIEIDGHTDSSGSEAHNVGLSRNRAESVAAHLRQAGVAPDWIRIRHHAASRPAASNADPSGRQLNRRTTVRLLLADEDEQAGGDRADEVAEADDSGVRETAADTRVRGSTPERT